MTNIFTDPRDGEIYKTVEIGGKIWLAENLRYRGPVKRFNDWTIEEKEFYFAPNGDRKNIKNYGCLYTWDNAIKACPEGWRLPSKKEFKALLTYVGSDVSTRSQNLRATTWSSGADKYGFSALPAGYYDGFVYHGFGNYASFWSAMESVSPKSSCAYGLYLISNDAIVLENFKGIPFSVRCIKD